MIYFWSWTRTQHFDQQMQVPTAIGGHGLMWFFWHGILQAYSSLPSWGFKIYWTKRHRYLCVLQASDLIFRCV